MLTPHVTPAQDTSSPPGHGLGLVLFALALGGFAIGTTEFATMSVLPLFARSLNIDAPTAGHVISAYALGVVAGAPVIAVLGARLARRTLLMLLMGIFAAGNALSAIAPDYHWMLAFRFLSGLPHGAYFGAAMLVAASLVPENRRTVAVGRVLMGLSIATIVGVPVADWLGQAVGWRWTFALVALLGAATLVCVGLFAPRTRADPGASPLRELGALARGQVWLTLGIGAIGFGGLFSVYTYLTDILGAVTGMSAGAAPVVLAVFGAGMTVGNLVVPLFADRALMRTAGGLLVWSAVVLALFPLAAAHVWSVTLDGVSDRHRRFAQLGAPDPADGRGRTRAGSGGRAQPLGLQRRQRAWAVSGRTGAGSGLRLDGSWLGRQPARARRAGAVGRVGVDRSAAGCRFFR